MSEAKRTIKELEKIKTVLLNRKKELEHAIAQLQQDDDSGSQVQDPGDQAISAAFESLKSSLHNNEYEEYKVIEKALKMLDSGEYGICADCQQNISQRRLELYPNATRCLSCQELVEEQSYRDRSNNFF
mgnify:CR=1 FL=1